MADAAPEKATNPVDPVYFYVLARNDFATMVQGRSDAQVSHATSNMHMLFMRRALQLAQKPTLLGADYTTQMDLFKEWIAQAGDFGTTIVLEGPMEDICAAVEFAKKAGYDAGVTHDPEYWRTDGKKAFCLPEDTCGWMIGRKGELRALLSRWELLKARPPRP